jgi:hypothetical protein
MEAQGHTGQVERVIAADAALKRSKRGGSRTLVAKELAEAAEERGSAEETAQPQKGGSASHSGAGGFGGKAKGNKGGGKGGKAKGFGKR